MNPSFNLIDEPWIPCALPGGEHVELSLRDTLTRAAEIEEIVAESPPATAALHRMLLAVLHRCFGPETVPAWQALWQRGSFDADAINAYLERWRSRFDLFDDEWPFFQTANVPFEKLVPAARMLFQGNLSTLFDHTVDADPPALSPAQAARWVLASQSFDTGGLILGNATTKYAKASPLTQCAVCIVRGRSAFETLMLNLYRYSPEDDEPFSFDPADDRPAWERETETEPVDRWPAGYLDLITWQSRRIRLRPETTPAGMTYVRRTVMMRGFGFSEGFHRHGRETMVAFRRRREAKPGQDPWPALGFQEEKALWRDSLALLASVEEDGARPKMMSWLAHLSRSGVIDRATRIPLDAYGVAVNQRKIDFWRHERLTLPLTFLEDSEAGRLLIGQLRQALALAERAARLLGPWPAEAIIAGKQTRIRSPMRVLANEFIGASGDPTDFIEHLAPERGYWSNLERPFQDLLDALPARLVQNSWGEPELDDAALRQWAGAVTRTVRAAFDDATRGLESSAKGMRAVALAERERDWRLAELMAPYRETAVGGVS